MGLFDVCLLHWPVSISRSRSFVSFSVVPLGRSFVPDIFVEWMNEWANEWMKRWMGERMLGLSEGPSSQSCGFSSGHVWMWELDYKESWAPKNWWFWTVVLEKTLESPLYCKKIQPAHPKGNQSRIFSGRTDAIAETPILWPPDVKNWLIGKDPDAGKDWRWEEKGTTKDEMVGCHHWLNGLKFEQALGDSEGQGSLACCSPWGHKEMDTTEWLNNNNDVKICFSTLPGIQSKFSKTVSYLLDFIIKEKTNKQTNKQKKTKPEHRPL